MIEMDRFVHNLEGSDSEVIVRESRESAATMKEQGFSLTEYITLLLKVGVGYKYLHFSLMADLRVSADIGTLVGFPHNMLLPRYL